MLDLHFKCEKNTVWPNETSVCVCVGHTRTLRMYRSSDGVGRGGGGGEEATRIETRE